MSTDKRKLAAVMFTDIVGWSGMMSRDESRAHALLLEHNHIVEEVAARHSGRVLKTMGDAFFIEFDAAFNAVQCAVDIQTALKEYNLDKPADSKIFVRIGLHIGDVIVDGDDLYGEGVNVAARLQPLADPGGVCMSQAVYQAVKAHTPIEAVHVGEVELKNIIEKYVVYKIPPLYAVETGYEEAEAPVRPATGLLRFKVKEVRRWPTVGRSRWLYIIKWTIIFYIVRLASGFSLTLLLTPYFANLSEKYQIIQFYNIYDPISFVNKLRQPRDPVSVFIREQITANTRQLIDEYDGKSSVSIFLLHKIVRDISILIIQRTPFNIPDYYATHPDEKARYEMCLSAPDSQIAAFNLNLLYNFYSHDLCKDESLRSYYLLRIGDLFSFPRSLIMLIFTILFLYFIPSPTSSKAVFTDTRDLDRALTFITSEMRFRRKRMGIRGIEYRRWGIFGWLFRNLCGLRAVVDGNVLLLTGGNIVIHRAKRLLNLQREPVRP